MKVTKKNERLARALLLWDLIGCGFPEDLSDNRVDEAWPGMLKKAEWLNKIVLQTDDYELRGVTTQSEIDRWSNDQEEP